MEFQIKTTVMGVDRDGRETTKNLLERLKTNKQKLTIPNIDQDVEHKNSHLLLVEPKQKWYKVTEPL